MLEMFCYARDIETYSSSTDPSLKLLSVVLWWYCSEGDRGGFEHTRSEIVLIG